MPTQRLAPAAQSAQSVQTALLTPAPTLGDASGPALHTARDGATPPHAGHQRRKSERPTELLESALLLFTERGFAATRAEEVAQRAGVSKGTLYLYYASKEELLKAVIRNYLANEISAIGHTVLGFQGSVSDGLRTLLVPWWTHLLHSPSSGVFKLMMAEMNNFPELAEFYRAEVIEPGERILGQALKRGIDGGEFRPFEIPLVVHSLLMPLVMLCIHKHATHGCIGLKQHLDAAAFIRSHIDLILEGLYPRATA